MRIQNNRNRRGVTLLFVVSMIVLFLLMGTTFVVLANDYFRASRKRAKAKLYTIDRTAYVHRSFYSLIRGPELENTNSVLRGHDILGDMYGYGLKATVRSAEVIDAGRQVLIRVELNDTTWTVPDARTSTDLPAVDLLGLRNILDDARARAQNSQLPADLIGGYFDITTGQIQYAGTIDETDTTQFPHATYFPVPSPYGKRYFPSLNGSKSPIDAPGYFGGQVLSFTTGIAKGVSGRILDYAVTIDEDGNVVRSFVILPEGNVTGRPTHGQATATPFDNETITVGGFNVTEIESIGEIWSTYPNRPTATNTRLMNVPSTVVINGRPFSGFGAGTRVDSGGNSLISDAPVAFRPNQARFTPDDLPQYPDNDGNAANGKPWQDSFFLPASSSAAQRAYSALNISINEPYDAFDHDNVFLAQPNASPLGVGASFNPVQVSPTHYGPNDHDLTDPMNPVYIPENIYSFRPVHQWDPQNPGVLLANSTANENFPNIWDYDVINPPTGFNRVPHQPQSRPLDVDNDGDGTMDSVWIDVGHGIHITPDGRKFKPLVAAMVVEMDSRLNLNVHGNYADAEAHLNPAADRNRFMSHFDFLGGATAAAPGTMARGYGWGPAEISLSAVVADYRALLYGLPVPDISNPYVSTTPNLPGRYGYDKMPGSATVETAALFRFSDHPATGTVGGSFKGAPLDIQGRFAFGFANEPGSFQNFQAVDGSGLANFPVGMPIVDIDTSNWPPQAPYYNTTLSNYPGTNREIHNSPYEVSLYRGSPNLTGLGKTENGLDDDTLFTPEELEAILRPFDVDSPMIQGRLTELFLQIGVNPTSLRALMTTDSWEVPALPPADRTVPERLYEILTSTHNALTHNQAFLHMRGGEPFQRSDGMRSGFVFHSLLPAEVMRGLPMNVNRPFGDGADNDGDGITDEHWDSNNTVLNEALSEFIPGTTVPIDHTNDGISDVQDRFARQIFARHLFVLTWLVASTDTDADGNPEIPDVNRDDTHDDLDIVALAQWCANVVDFRDADSICTPFEFDYDPWDGWSVDSRLSANEGEPGMRGNTDTNRGLVWGCERPEILITEAIATHERRMTDEEGDAGRFDSKYVPKSSVFVELHNPWGTSNMTQSRPSEFYNGAGEINLQAVNRVIGGSDEADPVWRMVFVRDRTSDANDRTDARAVYFIKPSADVEADDDGNWYYPSDQAPAAGHTGFNDGEAPIAVGTLAPNNYAVVGSAGMIDPSDNYRTNFGRLQGLAPIGSFPKTDLRLDETRSITLIPGTGLELNKWDPINNTMDDSIERPCIAIPINRRGRGATNDDRYRSLGLLDPNEGYDRGGSAATWIDPDMDMDPTDGDGQVFNTHVVEGVDRLRPSIAGGTGGMNSGYTFPEMRGNPLNDGLTTGVRFVRLQRLANPEAPYHDEFNPYVTVDDAPIDLHSFNGILSQTAQDSTIGNGDVPPGGPNAGDMFYAFDSMERGEEADTDRYLWRAENRRGGSGAALPDTSATDPNTNNTAPSYYDATGDNHLASSRFIESLGAMNDVHRQDASMANLPYDWFQWNNRPYVSGYELAIVPMMNAENLLRATTNAQGDPMGFHTRQGNHLIYFNDSIMKRLFGFIEVPPRFIDSEVAFDPTVFDNDHIWIMPNTTNGAEDRIDTPDAFVMNPPYNYSSRYRYPGKVNINGITDATRPVWNQGMMENWNVGYGRLTSVRGDVTLENAPDGMYYGGSDTDGNTTPDHAEMPNPMTARRMKLNLDPIRPLALTDFVPPRAIPDSSEVDAHGTDRPDGALLRPVSEDNFYRSSGGGPYADPSRDFYLQTTAITKLGNIATNRSSVFAIWITVGYFEVDEAGRLGAEIGSDTGEVNRNRGFYIYDRSIPVAYEPGLNHNVERGILVQSIIE